MKCGRCKRIKENFCADCPYLVARDLAKNNWITNMNYAYYLNIVKTPILSPRNLLVLDESHILESVMISARNT